MDVDSERTFRRGIRRTNDGESYLFPLVRNGSVYDLMMDIAEQKLGSKRLQITKIKYLGKDYLKISRPTKND